VYGSRATIKPLTKKKMLNFQGKQKKGKMVKELKRDGKISSVTYISKHGNKSKTKKWKL
jgi:hypothetical protein